MKPKLEKYSDILYRGSTVPTLDEVRGKAVLLIQGDNSILGCGIKINCGNKIGTATVGDVEFVYQNCWDIGRVSKSMKEYEFLDKYNTRLPEAGEHTSRGYINYFSSSKVPFGDKPKDIAAFVNPVLYLSPDTDPGKFWLNNPVYQMHYGFYKNEYSNYGKYGLLSERGRHFGWVYSDFVTEDMARMLWLTIFPNGLKFCTATYTVEGKPIAERKVTLDAASIVDPGEVKITPPNAGYYITGWKNTETGEVYLPGDYAVFQKDTVLEAQWAMTWKSLAESMRTTEPTTIRLPSDIVAEEDDQTIHIFASGNITIDLNGHTLDANAKEGGILAQGV